MADGIRESDWKVFRQVHAAALQRFCERILSEVTRLAGDTSTGSHERYLLVYELIQQRNGDIATVFDDFRRSTALRQLVVMRARGLVTDEEFARFSPEAREVVDGLVEILKHPRGSG
jgi:hypothetical protein